MVTFGEYATVFTDIHDFQFRVAEQGHRTVAASVEHKCTQRRSFHSFRFSRMVRSV